MGIGQDIVVNGSVLERKIDANGELQIYPSTVNSYSLKFTNDANVINVELTEIGEYSTGIPSDGMWNIKVLSNGAEVQENLCYMLHTSSTYEIQYRTSGYNIPINESEVINFYIESVESLVVNSGIIMGVVTTNQFDPIEGAKISVDGYDPVYTITDGSYEIKNVAVYENGTVGTPYRVVVEKDSYMREFVDVMIYKEVAPANFSDGSVNLVKLQANIGGVKGTVNGFNEYYIQTTLPGVKVSVFDSNSNLMSSTISNSIGKFTLISLPVNEFDDYLNPPTAVTYKITAEKDLYNIYETDINLYHPGAPNTTPLNMEIELIRSDDAITVYNAECPYNIITKLVDEKSPDVNTIVDYKSMMNSVQFIVDENVGISNKINDILITFLKYNKVNYDINNLTSNNLFTINGTTSLYSGSFHYDHTAKLFYMGSSSLDLTEYVVGYPPNTQLNYVYKADITKMFEDSNFDFISVLSQEKDRIINNSEALRLAVNHIALNLNKKLSFTVGMHNAMVEHYSNYKELIDSNLKYFRNYNEVKKYSLILELKKIDLYESYVDLLSNIKTLYDNGETSAFVIEYSLGMDGIDKYNNFIDAITTTQRPTLVGADNYIIYRCFYNLKNSGVIPFLKDFSELDVSDIDMYNKFLLASLDLRLSESLFDIYSGMQYLSDSIESYAIDYMFNKPKNGVELHKADAKFNLSDLYKTALVSTLNIVKNVTMSTKQIMELFSVNDRYNLFLDFDVKASSKVRAELKVSELVDKYKYRSVIDKNVLPLIDELGTFRNVYKISISRTMVHKHEGDNINSYGDVVFLFSKSKIKRLVVKGCELYAKSTNLGTLTSLTQNMTPQEWSSGSTSILTYNIQFINVISIGDLPKDPGYEYHVLYTYTDFNGIEYEDVFIFAKSAWILN